jgi:hypothetical protein
MAGTALRAELARSFAAMRIASLDPLTRPTPADESAVAGHPLPQGGEGIFMTNGEPKAHEVCAQDDSAEQTPAGIECPKA